METEVLYRDTQTIELIEEFSGLAEWITISWT